MQTRQSLPQVPRLQYRAGGARESGGQRRWMRIRERSARVEGGFPPVGSDPPRLRRWSQQNAARGRGSPEPGPRAGPGAPDPGTRPRAGSREATQGTPGWLRSLTTAPKGRRMRAASRWRPALPGIPPNSLNPKIPKIPKAKLQAGRLKFGNGLPGFPASCLDSGYDECAQGRAPPRVAGDPSAATLHVPGTPPWFFFFFTRKSPQPRFPAGTCRALASSRFLPPPAPPPKGNLGPARILWNVLCNLLYICFHGTARCKIAGFRGAGVNCALVSGDVRRTRGGVPG